MNSKHSSNFRKWQKKFYNSKEWIDLRNYIRVRDLGICQICGGLILKEKWIVDHKIEINEKNKEDIEITLNEKNLQLLCITCHNKKTFSKKIEMLREVDFEKRDKF